ncbi:MAG: hypothetical protein WCV93_01300 [Candidatus Shapirobacteria bacterium]
MGPILLFALFFLNPNSSFSIESVKSVSISATIGLHQATIFGYTSPNSRVEITSPRVYSLTFSDPNGYFEFTKTILPENPSDLCLSSTDESSRRSLPVCIPPPPPNNYHTDLGPIILPPTLTLDADNLKAYATTPASGQTIPNSLVLIHFYQVSSTRSLIPEAHAASLPPLETKSNQQGRFSFSLPTDHYGQYRLFATTLINSSPSPNSFSLNYRLKSESNLLSIILLLCYFFTLITLIVLVLLNQKKSKHYFPALFPKSLIPFQSNSKF